MTPFLQGSVFLSLSLSSWSLFCFSLYECGHFFSQDKRMPTPHVSFVALCISSMNSDPCDHVHLSAHVHTGSFTLTQHMCIFFLPLFARGSCVTLECGNGQLAGHDHDTACSMIYTRMHYHTTAAQDGQASTPPHTQTQMLYSQSRYEVI